MLLKEADKKLAIVGYMQKETETEKVWDYSAVPYPEGMFSSGNIHL
ncbi:MAG: DUF4176 domain-containing protein, partial [Defluviitaleaceae bacterium]|nr:DUF4176 domain-containing protein [Defluviitaleaceae bacterium]